MLLLVVWIAVAVLALVVLGSLGYTLLGSVRRLRREVEGARRDLAPVLAQVQATAAAAEQTRDRAAERRA